MKCEQRERISSGSSVFRPPSSACPDKEHSDCIGILRFPLFPLQFSLGKGIGYSTAGAFDVLLESGQDLAAFAGPAFLTGGYADHQRIGRNISVHNGTGGDKGVLSNGMAAQDRGIGPDGGAFPDQGFMIVIRTALRVFTAGINDIGKDHGRAAKDIVFQLHTFVNRNIVLDLDVIADAHIRSHIDILTKGAVGSDTGTGLNMAEVPDLGPGSELDVVVDVAAFVDEWFVFHLELTHDI